MSVETIISVSSLLFSILSLIVTVWNAFQLIKVQYRIQYRVEFTTKVYPLLIGDIRYGIKQIRSYISSSFDSPNLFKEVRNIFTDSRIEYIRVTHRQLGEKLTTLHDELLPEIARVDEFIKDHKGYISRVWGDYMRTNGKPYNRDINHITAVYNDVYWPLIARNEGEAHDAFLRLNEEQERNVRGISVADEADFAYLLKLNKII